MKQRTVYNAFYVFLWCTAMGYIIFMFSLSFGTPRVFFTVLFSLTWAAGVAGVTAFFSPARELKPHRRMVATILAVAGLTVLLLLFKDYVFLPSVGWIVSLTDVDPHVLTIMHNLPLASAALVVNAWGILLAKKATKGEEGGKG